MTKEEIAEIVQRWWQKAYSRGDERLASVKVLDDSPAELGVETADGRTFFIEVQDV